MNKSAHNSLEVKRHSLCHVMTFAVKKLFGQDIQLGVGPVIENGFYQDFDRSFSPADLILIEQEMKKIIASGFAFEYSEQSIAEAISYFEQVQQPLKVELLHDLREHGSTNIKSSAEDPPCNSSAIFYAIGSHVDLCRGPHVAASSDLKDMAFRLDRVAGAYWRGDERNQMLTRIYALAFESEQGLKDFLERREEAKRRDHRLLGEQLGWFFFHESAPGMPYWLPKGLKIKNLLVQYWRQYHEQRGYQEIAAPLINKRELWETSGHWEHYKDNMILAELGDGGQWALKPMNCANAMLVWKSRQRSYKELPLRLSDTDLLHRNEASGSLQGMMRARCFCQDDSHNFVSPDQIQAEIEEILDIAKDFYGVFGLVENVKLYLSTRPEEFMGTIEEWDRAEAELLEVLKKSGFRFGIKEKEGAFYAPKIDIHLEDALGREWQCGTIQADFQLPQNFKLEYIAQDGSRQCPVVIHRVIYGSIERFLGILIEHTSGNLPFWIAPVQVKVLTVGDCDDYAQKVREKLQGIVLNVPLRFNELRFEIDDRNESLNRKVRDAENEKVPVMVVIGRKEAEQGSLMVRQKAGGQQSILLDDLEMALSQLAMAIASS
ncbi:MAG: threonine--tRNA ligase [Bdellovibrionales bacterium]|nr:threonine--tRNA ligase [Bdellovibrionales bacterium]